MKYSRVKCPKCDKSFGQEKRFLTHLSDDHNIVDSKKLFDEVNYMGSSPFCACGCKKHINWNGWKKGYTSRFLRGHNSHGDSVYKELQRQKEINVKRKEGFATGKYSVQNNELKRETFNKKFPPDMEGYNSLLLFVNSLGVTIKQASKSEIYNIEIPSRKLCIEYADLHYHSVIQNKKHAIEKFNKIQQAGDSLLTIYADEWRDHKQVIQGMIRHRLNMQARRFFARSLQLREITKDEAKLFFNENHLEGYARCTVAYGLVTDQNEVVAAMSLRRPFHKAYTGYYELARSCCHRDSVVPGWLGKITKHLKIRAKKDDKLGIMTYVDARVGPGTGYAAAGWTMINNSTGPRFWWTDYENRFNRFKYKADKSRGMTQAQIAEEAGVVTIHGGSNSRWQVTV